ncbi:unnamed protein product [Pieris macdunnoughi]|uniref:Uncharacterized protein n=1 Tax=Pieris macdunnoughi TaxID=345717 RepID=A0A821WLV4_9NEOP|nr:unnamed protein product [Pieris macdunnoughi]
MATYTTCTSFMGNVYVMPVKPLDGIARDTQMQIAIRITEFLPMCTVYCSPRADCQTKCTVKVEFHYPTRQLSFKQLMRTQVVRYVELRPAQVCPKVQLTEYYKKMSSIHFMYIEYNPYYLEIMNLGLLFAKQ